MRACPPEAKHAEFSPADLKALSEVEEMRCNRATIVVCLLSIPLLLLSGMWGWGLAAALFFAGAARDAAFTAVRTELHVLIMKLSYLNYFKHVNNVAELANPIHSIEFMADIPIESAFDKALASVAVLRDFKVTTCDMVEGRIIACRKHLTYSEEVVIQVNEEEVDLTKVTICSRKLFKPFKFGDEKLGESVLNVARLRAAFLGEASSEKDLKDLFKKPRLCRTSRDRVILIGLGIYAVTVLSQWMTSSCNNDSKFWDAVYANNSQAINDYASQVMPYEEEKANLYTGVALVQLGKFDEGLEFLQKAQESKELALLANVHAFKAIAYVGRHDLETALQECKDASTAYRRYCISDEEKQYGIRARIAYSYGVVYEAMGRPDEALHFFTQSIDFNDYPAAYRKRAELLEKHLAATAAAPSVEPLHVSEPAATTAARATSSAAKATTTSSTANSATATSEEEETDAPTEEEQKAMDAENMAAMDQATVKRDRSKAEEYEHRSNGNVEVVAFAFGMLMLSEFSRFMRKRRERRTWESPEEDEVPVKVIGKKKVSTKHAAAETGILGTLENLKFTALGMQLESEKQSEEVLNTIKLHKTEELMAEHS